MVDLVFENYTASQAPGKEFFKKILETAARKLKLNKNFSVSVNLVGEKKIQELNKKYRNKNKPADVLSFPMQKKLEIENWKLKIPKSKTKIFDLGDIFVCLSIAKNEAKRENITIKEKLTGLVVHGFLHLLGYDHEVSEASARKMFNLESRILDKLNLG